MIIIIEPFETSSHTGKTHVTQIKYKWIWCGERQQDNRVYFENSLYWVVVHTKAKKKKSPRRQVVCWADLQDGSNWKEKT